MRVDDLSPAWRSEFILHAHGAEVAELADCIAVRTPANPHFYWGNFLLLPSAPADADLAHWLQRFEAWVAQGRPLVRHVAIGINAPRQGEMRPAWLAAGFECMDTTALSLQPAQLRAPAQAPRGAVIVRPIDFEREMAAAVDLQCASNDGFEPTGYRAFRHAQMQRYAALAARGQAQWFGAWCDRTLAADCGLIRESGARTARFQLVSTHPQWRRRGLCRALIYGVSQWGFGHWAAQQLLMCADPADVAIGIYQSLGYTRIGEHWHLQRRAPHDVAANAATDRAPPAPAAPS